MNDEEKYLFDLRGYLVVPDVLSADEVSSLNAHLDDHGLWEDENRHGFSLIKRYNDHVVNAGPLHLVDRPVRSLIAHPKILGYLSEVLGPDLRYDEGQVLLARPGAGALILHNGHTPWEFPPLTYQVRDNHIYGGHIVVAFCLTDALEDHGGFAVVPGSHKANFPCPDEYAGWEKVGEWVSRVPVRAGSAVIFVDTATHGSWPWTADFERRVAFCRYTAGMVAHTWPSPVAEETPYDDWTPVERRLLRAPYAWTASQDGGRFEESQRVSVDTADGWVMSDYSHQYVPVTTPRDDTTAGA